MSCGCTQQALLNFVLTGFTNGLPTLSPEHRMGHTRKSPTVRVKFSLRGSQKIGRPLNTVLDPRSL